MAANDRTEGVLVQVCLECGKEHRGMEPEASGELRCDKCGNSVFREFYAAAENDEVAQDYREATDRDVLPEDPSTDVTRGDLHDLGNL